MTVGRSIMPRREKFSEKSFWVLSSQNRTREGVGSEEEVDALERKGFQDGVDLRLGAIEQTNARKRETIRKNTNKTIYKNIKI